MTCGVGDVGAMLSPLLCQPPSPSGADDEGEKGGGASQGNPINDSTLLLGEDGRCSRTGVYQTLDEITRDGVSAR